MICACYVVHDDTYYLAESIASFKPAGDVFVFVSRLPWSGEPGDWEATAKIAGEAGAEVILGDWAPEDTHRQAALEELRQRGYSHAITPDGDEIVEPELLETLLRIAGADLADRVYIHWNTYWKSPEYVIRPREPFQPHIMFNLQRARHVHVRHYEGGRPLLLAPEYGIIHHLSYVGPDERILRKTSTWCHKDEVLDGWLQHRWRAWDSDRLLRDLHPTNPPCYRMAERVPVPPILQSACERFQKLAGVKIAPTPSFAHQTLSPPLFLGEGPQHQLSEDAVRGGGRGGLSVVIPLHGGVEDITACLESLRACRDLLHEVIVVDNASTDGAAEAADAFDFVKLIRNDSNLGFSAACNIGANAASGGVLLFLNSDTVVPRAGLIRLAEALTRSGTIAAAGPYTNNAGHLQQIAPTYTSLDTLDLFAEDFAARDAEDVDTDMLVGFCLAVKRSVWDEIGGFDERFGMGMFEDNDLSYRCRRAGYRLVIAAQSYVHHSGSRTLRRSGMDARALFMSNRAKFAEKWREDVESGFASHLSGLPAPAGRAAAQRYLGIEPIRFDRDRSPEARARRAARAAVKADISLCMIVRNEERVLADCLRSARPFFREMIVVDTGSHDRTKEIAREFGAQVHDFPWTDSFSEARNESLRHARGAWIFWMDADDTLPFASGEALLDMAISAPRDTAGFVIPVQFVEAGPGGTRVDHVKLFRNAPGVEFKYHIHEQVLPSLRAGGGRIDEGRRCVVLHSGYDRSPEGQAKKRERDLPLLALDLAEFPDDPFVLFNVGMTDHFNGDHEKAVDWLRKSLDRCRPGDSIVRKAWALLVVSLKDLGRQDEALEAANEGLVAAPGDPELHFRAGQIMAEQGRRRDAISHYEQALSADLDGHFSSVDVGILGHKTQHNLGILCLAEGDYGAAKSWWLKAIDSASAGAPLSGDCDAGAGATAAGPSAHALFEAALESADFGTARQMMEVVRRGEPGGKAWAEMALRYGAGVGDPSGGEETLRAASLSDPSAVGARLVLCRRLLESEREAESRPELTALAEMGVAEAAFMSGVAAVRRRRLEEGLRWMERAQELDPGHAETAEQVECLRRALGLDGRQGPDDVDGLDVRKSPDDRDGDAGRPAPDTDGGVGPEAQAHGTTTAGRDSAAGPPA